MALTVISGPSYVGGQFCGTTVPNYKRVWTVQSGNGGLRNFTAIFVLKCVADPIDPSIKTISITGLKFLYAGNCECQYLENGVPGVEPTTRLAVCIAGDPARDDGLYNGDLTDAEIEALIPTLPELTVEFDYRPC